MTEKQSVSMFLEVAMQYVLAIATMHHTDIKGCGKSHRDVEHLLSIPHLLITLFACTRYISCQRWQMYEYGYTVYTVAGLYCNLHSGNGR